ncbi:aconitase X swivel domain-containing protein [Streptomyces sp. NPDC021218]|uniref:aconitase X swivel domain-containing protein n=1 Tax=unclassified Streptomyces TaxID=2593676 RepID=UPI00368C5F3A
MTARPSAEGERPATVAPATPLTLHGRTVVPGIAEGEALVSAETISGWGGIDPARGVVIERRHPLYGQSFAGKILVFPGAKGSSGWAGFFQATRLSGTAPLGMLFVAMSSKAALGAVVTRVPTMTGLDRDPLTVIRTGDQVRIDADHGTVTVQPADAGL